MLALLQALASIRGWFDDVVAAFSRSASSLVQRQEGTASEVKEHRVSERCARLMLKGASDNAASIFYTRDGSAPSADGGSSDELEAGERVWLQPAPGSTFKFFSSSAYAVIITEERSRGELGPLRLEASSTMQPLAAPELGGCS